MDWSEVTFLIFSTLFIAAIILLIVIVHYARKILRKLASPITARTSRK